MNTQSISISGVLTLDMHALNNEGAEGNTMMTRMVEIVDASGSRHTVNAISGDMLKHIQCAHLWAEATELNLPLCEACKVFDPNRVCADKSFMEDPKYRRKNLLDRTILDDVLARCVIDDLEGVLITNKLGLDKKGKPAKRSLPRKSCVEFGWAVGLPGRVATNSHFHAKYTSERGDSDVQDSGQPEGSGAGPDSSNLGQNIFHRPASSGQYAVVVGLDIFRVGRNDISLQVPVGGRDIEIRKSALVRSVVSTFVKPTGAHRNTQAPHILDFQGVIATSSSTLPAPSISPLNGSFVAEIERTAAVLNQMQPSSISVYHFDGLGAFAETMASILGPAVARVHA